MGLGPTKIPLTFETDLDHCRDRKKISKFWIFPFTYFSVHWQGYALFECSCIFWCEKMGYVAPVQSILLDQIVSDHHCNVQAFMVLFHMNIV